MSAHAHTKGHEPSRPVGAVLTTAISWSTLSDDAVPVKVTAVVLYWANMKVCWVPIGDDTRLLSLPPSLACFSSPSRSTTGRFGALSAVARWTGTSREATRARCTATAVVASRR